jgi:hypothetical protein
MLDRTYIRAIMFGSLTALLFSFGLTMFLFGPILLGLSFFPLYALIFEKSGKLIVAGIMTSSLIVAVLLGWAGIEMYVYVALSAICCAYLCFRTSIHAISGHFVVGLTLLAFVGFCIYVLLTGVPQEVELRQSLELLLGQLDPKLFEALTQGQQGSLFTILTLMPGLIGISWVTLHAVNVGIARKLFKSGEQIINIRVFPKRLPRTYIFAPVIAALMSLLSDPTWQYVGKNACIILIVPFFFLGLSYVHKKINNMQNSRIGYFAFYFLLVAFIWISVIITLYGIMQHLKEFRLSISKENIIGERK